MPRIGATIALDGEKQFKTAVTNCKQSLKQLDSEFKLATAQSKTNANSLDTLKTKHGILQKTLDKSKEKTEYLSEIVESQKEKFTKTGKKLEDYKTQLAAAQKTLEDMKASGTATDEELKEQEAIVKSLQTQVDKGTTAYQSAERQLSKWETELVNSKLETEKASEALAENDKYMDEAAESADGCATSIDNFGNSTADATSDVDDLNASLGKIKKAELINSAIKRVSSAIAGVADAAYDAAKELDDGYDTIVKKTGATGDALGELQEVANNIFTTMPVSMSDVGIAVGEVNTKFGLTGDALEELSERFLKFADINEQDVNTAIDNTQAILASFNMTTEDTPRLLDALTKAGQDTGVSLDTLESALISNSAVLEEMGLDAYGSIDFLANLSTCGGDVSTTMAAMKKALQKATSAGKPLSEALSEMQDYLTGDASEQDKLNKAIEIFGAKNGPKMLKLIESGAVNLNELSTATADYGDAVSKTYETTLDPWDKMTVAQNKLKTAGAELTSQALDALAPAFDLAADAADAAYKTFSDLPDGVKAVGGVIGLVVSAGAKVAPVCSDAVSWMSQMKAASDMTKAARQISSFGSSAADAADDMGDMVSSGNLVGTLTTALRALDPATIALIALGAAAVGVAVGVAQMSDEGDTSKQSFRNMIENAEAAKSAMQTAADNITGTVTTAGESLAQIDSQATYANNLIASLETLQSKTNLTTDEQKEQTSIISQLNALYPDLKLEIDETTGRLNTSIESIKSYVKNSAEMAKIDVYYDKIKTATEALVDAQEAQYKGESAITEVQNKHARMSEAVGRAETKRMSTESRMIALQDKLRTLEEEGKTNTEEYAQAQADLTTAQEENSAAISEKESALLALQGAEDELNSTEADLKEAQEELNGATEEAKKQVDHWADSLSDAQGNVKEYTDAQEENTEKTKEGAKAQGELGTAVDEASDDIEDAAKKQKKSFEEIYSSLKDGVTKSSNLFKKWEKDDDLTLQSWNEAMKSRADAYNEYNENVKRVTSDTRYSTDADFRAVVDSIVAMDEDGMQHMSLFVSAMDAKNGTLEKILENFGNVSDSADNFAKSVAGMQSSAEDAVDCTVSAFESGTSKVENAAGEVADAAADGVDGMSGDMSSTATAGVGAMAAALILGTIATKAASKLLKSAVDSETKGTSKKTKTNGTDAAKNFASGITSGKSGVQSAAKSVAGAFTTEANSAASSATVAGSNISTNFIKGLTTSAGKASTAANALVSPLNTALSGVVSKAKSAGSSAGSGFASALSGKQGSVSSAASGLGNAAGAQLTQVARNAATWGDHLGANFAQGIRNRRGDVASAAQQLAGAAAQYLHHTTPDAGPLMHDDQWGYHLAENIADAMERGAGLVGDASLSLASAVTGSFRSEVTPYQPSYGTQFYTGNGQQITSEVKIYLGERDVTDYITRKVVDRINSNMRMNRIAVGGI